MVRAKWVTFKWVTSRNEARLFARWLIRPNPEFQLVESGNIDPLNRYASGHRSLPKPGENVIVLFSLNQCARIWAKKCPRGVSGWDVLMRSEEEACCTQLDSRASPFQSF